MKNKIKFSKEIEEIGIKHLAVVGDKPANCLHIACCECDVPRMSQHKTYCDDTLKVWLNLESKGE